MACNMKKSNKGPILLISLFKGLDLTGLKYLHYYLLEHSCYSILLSLPRFTSDDETMRHIKSFVSEHNPLLIGISVMSDTYYQARHLTTYLKHNFKLPIVWGGIHPTVAPETCLQ